MMNEDFQKEAELIKQERAAYIFSEKPGIMFFQYLSNIFMVIGFFSLVLVFFTEITIVQATCFFIIGYTLGPSNADLNKLVLKGLIEDIANIRLNTAVISKNINSNKNT